MANLSPQQIAQYAYKAGFRGADLIKAVAIAIAESGGNPQAYNPNGEDSRGLWQINGRAHPQYNNPGAFDPMANAKAAFQVYREAGNSFTPWTTWTKGIASSIIPTLPKFKIDSAAARSQTTTKAVSQMVGTAGASGSAGVVAAPDEGNAIQQGISKGVDSAVQSVKNTILGKTAEGVQREGMDVSMYVIGAFLVLLGLIFLFLNTNTGKNTVALAGEGVKLAVAKGL